MKAVCGCCDLLLVSQCQGSTAEYDRINDLELDAAHERRGSRSEGETNGTGTLIVVGEAPPKARNISTF